jgi:Chaperone of endosialidase
MLVRFLATIGAGAALAVTACASNDTAPPSDGGQFDSAATGLHWYATCGDPICRTPDDAAAGDSGVAACTTGQNAGEPCTNGGDSCGDPDRNCGSVLLCTDHDPKVNGCPVSSRRFKQDIAYLSPSDAEELKAALLNVRLATFRYKQGDPGRHLGYILEDSPGIPASDLAHTRVDLYAYASMAVAALQVQAREIERLEAEVDALGYEVDSLAGKRQGSSRACPAVGEPVSVAGLRPFP